MTSTVLATSPNHVSVWELTVCHEFRDGPDRIVSCKGGLKSNDVRMTKKAANSDLARNTLNVLQALSASEAAETTKELRINQWLFFLAKRCRNCNILLAGFFERSFPDGDASV